MMNLSSDSIDLVAFHGRPRSTILRLLQRHGPLSIKQLEQELGVSTNAVREQLQQLQEAGLVQQHQEQGSTREVTARQTKGAGRPAHLYTLTRQAQQLFPQGYDLLLNLLFDEILAQDGASKLDALLQGVSVRLAERFADEQASALHTQLSHVQAALQRDRILQGTPEQQDGLRVETWSCPYIELATHHRGVCDMEAQMLQQVLQQPVQVERRIVDGAPGCCFVVGEQPVQSQDV